MAVICERIRNHLDKIKEAIEDFKHYKNYLSLEQKDELYCFAVKLLDVAKSVEE